MGNSTPKEVTPEEKPSSAERLALEAEISRRYPWITQSPNPIPYQREGFRAGAQWKAAQVAEAFGKLEEARKIEGIGWSLGTGTEISPKNEPATIAQSALRDLGEGQ